jgi:N-acetylmuramoyl-L-alanine amidase
MRRKTFVLRSFPLDERGELLARSVQQHVCRVSGAMNRGIKEKGYAVVVHTECPAVLVECGFLTHVDEAARLQKAVHLDRIAQGIASGVTEFLKTQRLRQSVSDPPEVLPAAVAAAIEEP